MLRIGILGFGFMGNMHYNCYKDREDASVVAICDADAKRLHENNGVAGNISGTKRTVDLTGIELFSNFGEMLQKANLDAVSITLPTYMHADFTCQALQAGVNVLCEKPMGLNITECDRMILAAEKSGKVLQIGHCVRFWPEYAKTKEIIDSDKYGKVYAATFRRLSSTPTWSHENWLLQSQRSGGMELDLHIHDTDYVQYLFGVPKYVGSCGVKSPNSGIDHIVTHYYYGGNKLVCAEGGWLMKPSFGFEMSFNIAMEEASIQFDCTRTPSFRICPQEGVSFTPELAPGDGYVREIDHFLRTIQGETLPEIITLESSREAVRIVTAEKESFLAKQKMEL